MFRCIHSNAKSEWLELKDFNKYLFRGKTMVEKLDALMQLAKAINGIGEVTVIETLLWIDQDDDYK